MDIKIDYEKCLAFIERTNRIKLYPFQKDMLYALCQGAQVMTCRCAGRTMITKGIGDYIAHTLDRAPVDDAVIAIPYTTIISQSRLLTPEWIERMKNCMSSTEFEREYSLVEGVK